MRTGHLISIRPVSRTFRVKNINQYAVVDADYADPSSAAEAAVALEISFGIALWIALAIHAAGIEIYLHLTPAEAERIRHFSYKRQIEAGMRHPGRAGTTSDQLGLSLSENQRRLIRDSCRDEILIGHYPGCNESA